METYALICTCSLAIIAATNLIGIVAVLVILANTSRAIKELAAAGCGTAGEISCALSDSRLYLKKAVNKPVIGIVALIRLIHALRGWRG